jgi:nucleoside-diphosphate-sugar epimerase
MALNVVVTGGAGYVGAVLVGKLLERGCHVRVIDEFADGDGSLEATIDRIEVIEAAPQAIQARWLKGADAVVHLAGLDEGSSQRSDPAANWIANAVATERVALACRRARVPRLTYASTCALYDTLPPGRECCEEAAVPPQTAFVASRLYAERRLRQMADSFFCPTILRHAIPCGWSPHPLPDTAPNRFVLDAVAAGQVTLPSDAWVARPFVDVEDLAEAHLCCLEAPARRVRGQVFNVVRASLRLREVADTVVDVVGREAGHVRVTASETPLGMRDCRCSAEKLHATLGFAPRKALAASVAEMARALTANAHRAEAASAVDWAPRPLFAFFAPKPPGGARESGSYSCWVGEREARETP